MPIYNKSNNADNETRYQNNDTVAETYGGGSYVGNHEAVIKEGDMLLGTYLVEAAPIKGGMGNVWRVKHTGWNMQLAMKRPRAECFQNKDQKNNFERECKSWMFLGLHENVVSCYYVRDIDGVPSIFYEWMDGRSLRDWIEDEGLYAGGQDNVRGRILDIALQCARGLHYIHERRDEDGKPLGLIHLDFKPENILMTQEGDAKVSDFGLARARAVLTLADSESDLPSDHDNTSKSIAYTPAYCSIEQLDGKVLSHQTDIYSWALTVLEMFLGQRPWIIGSAPGISLDQYLNMTPRINIPSEMKSLIRRCLEKKMNKRPRDFAAVEAELLKIYQQTTGGPYPRPASQTAKDTADSLNNRALSFLDIGQPQNAEQCFKKALQIDGNHPQALYNQALYLWRQGRITDIEAVNSMAAARLSNLPQAYALTLRLHLERGDLKRAALYPRKLRGNKAFREEAQQELALLESLSPKQFRKSKLSTTSCYAVKLCKTGRRALMLSNPGDRRYINVYDFDDRRFIWEDGEKSIDKTWNVLGLSDDGFSMWVEEKIDGGSFLTKRNVADFTKTYILPMPISNYNPLIDEVEDRAAFRYDKQFEFISLSTGETIRALRLDENEDGFVLPGLRRYLSLKEDSNLVKIGNIATGEELLSFEVEHMHCWSDLTDLSKNAGETYLPLVRYDLVNHTYANVPVELWNHHTGKLTDTVYVNLTDSHCCTVLPGDRYMLYTSGMWGDYFQLYDLVDHRVVRSYPIKGGNQYHQKFNRPVYGGRFCAVIAGRDSTGLVFDIPDFDFKAQWQICGVDHTAKRLSAEREFENGLSTVESFLSKDNKIYAYLFLTGLRQSPGFARSDKWLELMARATDGFDKEKLYKCRLSWRYHDDHNNGTELEHFTLSRKSAFFICAAKDEHYQYFLHMVDTVTGDKLLSLKADDAVFALSPNGEWLAFHQDERLLIRHLKTGEQIEEADGGLEFRFRAKWLSKDILNRIASQTNAGLGYWIDTKAMTFSHDGNLLYANGIVWDWPNGRPLEPYKFFCANDDLFRPAPDGRYLAVYQDGVSDVPIRLVDTQTGEVRSIYVKGGIPSFSPDGRFMATGHKSKIGGEIHIYDLNGEGDEINLIHCFQADTEEAGPVAFTSDGRFILAVTQNTMSYAGFTVINLETRQSLKMPIEGGPGYPRFHTAFTADDRQVFIGMNNGVYRWDFEWDYKISRSDYEEMTRGLDSGPRSNDSQKNQPAKQMTADALENQGQCRLTKKQQQLFHLGGQRNSFGLLGKIAAALFQLAGLFGADKKIKAALHQISQMDNQADLVTIAIKSGNDRIAAEAAGRVGSQSALIDIMTLAISPNARQSACGQLGHIWNHCICERCKAQNENHDMVLIESNTYEHPSSYGGAHDGYRETTDVYECTVCGKREVVKT